MRLSRYRSLNRGIKSLLVTARKERGLPTEKRRPRRFVLLDIRIAQMIASASTSLGTAQSTGLALEMERSISPKTEIQPVVEGYRILQSASYYVLPALPLVAFAGLFALFLGRLRRREEGEHDWRHAFLLSVAIWASLTFAFTELLSLGTALSVFYLGLSWGIAVLVLAFFLRRNPLPGLRGHAWSTVKKLPLGEKALWFWIALSLAITAAIAITAPPNNDDALTYHMSRVAHWWVNHTVAVYTTNIQRQLCLSPFAEYVILQFFALSGGSDRLANMVQWFSFGGCAIALSLIARRLGADRVTQYLVAFVVLTTNLSILQATSTHNDLACAFLAVTALYFLYCDKTVLTGICLGLAILVKLTAAFAVAPFLLILFFREPLHRRGVFQRAVGKLAAIGGIAVALNTPQWLRNIDIFDNPFSSEAHFEAGSPTRLMLSAHS